MANKITYTWPIDVQFDLGAIGGWFGGGGGGGGNDHLLLNNINGGLPKAGGHLYLTQRLVNGFDPLPTNDIVPTIGGISCLIGALWTNNVSKQSFVCVDNTATAAVWKQITDAASTQYQTTIIDDTTTNIVVADTTLNRTAWLEYVLDTSTTHQIGTCRILYDGAVVDLHHEYNFIPPEIVTVNFTADILGNDIRINVEAILVGEDPEFRYTIRTIELT